jgi:membrane peptidoglycan carboxypeptidase
LVLLEDAPALPPSSAAIGISPVDAYLVTHLLRETVRAWYGTGHDAASLGAPVVGKTGSTNDNRDAWFVGYSPSVVTGVWVGNDDRTPMGPRETGSRAALPIWKQFMRAAIEARPGDDFALPEGVAFSMADSITGQRVTSDRPIAGWTPVARGRKVRAAKYVAPPEPPPVAVVVPVISAMLENDGVFSSLRNDPHAALRPRADVDDIPSRNDPGHRPWMLLMNRDGDSSTAEAQPAPPAN